MSEWTIRSAELRRRRIEKMLAQTELAKLAVISVSALRRLEASDVGVALATIDNLTKPLGCKRGDIATSGLTKKGAPSRETNGAKSAAHDAANGDRVRLADLRAIQIRLPEPEAIVIDGERIPMLTVIRYQQCLSAHVARDGMRFWIEGRVADERGLLAHEAALLGARFGEATRFDLQCPIGDDGHMLGVTAFTRTAPMTIEVQEASEKIVRVVLRLVALRDLAPGAGLPFFMRERPNPWALVVEKVIAVKPPAKESARGKRGARRAPSRPRTP